MTQFWPDPPPQVGNCTLFFFSSENFPKPLCLFSSYQNIILILYFRRPSATLRLRLLGNSSSSLPPGKAAKPGDKGELSRLWQQLKTDIEAAMAKKPASERSALDQTGPGAGQYKRFSVIRREVGVIPFQTDLFLAFYTKLIASTKI